MIPTPCVTLRNIIIELPLLAVLHLMFVNGTVFFPWARSCEENKYVDAWEEKGEKKNKKKCARDRIDLLSRFRVDALDHEERMERERLCWLLLPTRRMAGAHGDTLGGFAFRGSARAHERLAGTAGRVALVRETCCTSTCSAMFHTNKL